MGQIVNLGKARKAAKRTQKTALAKENAAKFGRTKEQKHLDEAKTAKAVAHLDAHRRDGSDDGE